MKFSRLTTILVAQMLSLSGCAKPPDNEHVVEVINSAIETASAGCVLEILSVQSGEGDGQNLYFKVEIAKPDEKNVSWAGEVLFVYVSNQGWILDDKSINSLLDASKGICSIEASRKRY